MLTAPFPGREDGNENRARRSADGSNDKKRNVDVKDDSLELEELVTDEANKWKDSIHQSDLRRRRTMNVIDGVRNFCLFSSSYRHHIEHIVHRGTIVSLMLLYRLPMLSLTLRLRLHLQVRASTGLVRAVPVALYAVHPRLFQSWTPSVVILQAWVSAAHHTAHLPQYL